MTYQVRIIWIAVYFCGINYNIKKVYISYNLQGITRTVHRFIKQQQSSL